MPFSIYANPLEMVYDLFTTKSRISKISCNALDMPSNTKPPAARKVLPSSVQTLSLIPELLFVLGLSTGQA